MMHEPNDQGAGDQDGAESTATYRQWRLYYVSGSTLPWRGMAPGFDEAMHECRACGRPVTSGQWVEAATFDALVASIDAITAAGRRQ